MSALQLSAVVGTALVSGIFYAFSTFVMRALARLAPAEGIAAMQSINVAVLNPWFFAAFFGTGGLAVATVVAGARSGGLDAWTLAGAGLYLVGCIGVTIVGNVPLNDRLAEVGAASEAGAALWDLYLTRWTVWNHVRTAASLLAALALWMGMRTS